MSRLKGSLVLVLAFLLLLAVFGVVLKVPLVRGSGTIYIRANGSVEGTTYIASSNNVTYVFTANINDLIVVERSNIIIDGKGYTLQGAGSGNGFSLLNVSNVTIKNTNIKYFDYGIWLSGYSNYNSITANNITNNGVGILLAVSSNNSIYHNNFINNTKQVDVTSSGYANVWDNGYPSGGNYWSDYAGVDADGDGIGDTAYVIDANNRDRYPLMKPWSQQEHEVVTSITAPASLWLRSSSSINAIVTNEGLNDEVNVKLSLPINGTIANSTTIPLLKTTNSYTLSYLWTPTVEGTYNVTAYAQPVPGETSVKNNKATKFVTVSTPQVGVKAGDWIKITYTITGWPAGTPYPEWVRIEFLSVVEANATVRQTLHMSNGTELSDIRTVAVEHSGGIIIPANSKVGDSINMGAPGFDYIITIEGETTRTYAGASRTVVYASFSFYQTQLTYHWDKQTGVMVEEFIVSGSTTQTAKATETNLWQPASTPSPNPSSSTSSSISSSSTSPSPQAPSPSPSPTAPPGATSTAPFPSPSPSPSPEPDQISPITLAIIGGGIVAAVAAGAVIFKKLRS